VKTFLVSYDGLVYEKDLGPETLKIAQSMERWIPIRAGFADDQRPDDALDSSE